MIEKLIKKNGDLNLGHRKHDSIRNNGHEKIRGYN